MKNLAAVARLLFVIPMAAIGIEHFLFASQATQIVPPWVPGPPALAYVSGTILIVLAGGIMSTRGRFSSAILGAALLACFVLYHVYRMASDPANGILRTRGFETLALAATAWMLARTISPERSEPEWQTIAITKIAEAGKWLFSISLLVFGVDHFVFAKFVAVLQPAWIPGHMFWAYFTGAAFVAAAAAIAFKRLQRLASGLLGLMFLLWFLILHVPLVASHLRDGNQWASAFLALGMCGASWIIATDREREAAAGVLRKAA